MSETTIDTEWAAALKQAAAIDDYDARYSICERFLGRAVTRIVGHSANCSWLAAMWYDRNRRDWKCADKARFMMPTCDELERPVLKIISELDVEDLYVDPESVGVACAGSAYITVLLRMSAHITCVRDMMSRDRAAEIARDDEKRLQILDVQEELALLARARGEEVEA